MDSIYTIIVPTHRPEFLEKLIDNISHQFTKPDRIIFILDKATEHQTNEIITNKRFLFAELTKIYIIRSGLTGALNAFKQCFRQMEQFFDSKIDNYYMIMEDDVYFIGMSTFKYIKNMIIDYNKVYSIQNFDIINLPIIDTDRNGKLEFGSSNPLKRQNNILDTCSCMYKFNILNINLLQELNKKIKFLPYSLIADFFVYNYLSNKQTSYELKLSKICLVSTIHPNQISNDKLSQLNESALLWNDEFRLGKLGRKDIWLQHLVSLRCAHKYFGFGNGNKKINFEQIKIFDMSIRKDIKKYKYILTLSLKEFRKELLNMMVHRRTQSIQNLMNYILNFDLNRPDLDINPYLKDNLC